MAANDILYFPDSKKKMIASKATDASVSTFSGWLIWDPLGRLTRIQLGDKCRTQKSRILITLEHGAFGPPELAAAFETLDVSAEEVHDFLITGISSPSADGWYCRAC